MLPNLSKKPAWVGAAAFVVLLGLFGAYRFSVGQARQVNYLIFNIQETVSWVENETGIYRREAQGHLDNLLLSIDPWREARLSFDLLNPRDCGLIFHYQDPQTYHFLYFHRPTQSVFWARKTPQGTQVIERHALPQAAVFKGRLEISPFEAKLFYRGHLLSELKIKGPTGPFGILINDADDPRTIFHQLKVSGILASGRRASGISPPQFKQAGMAYLLSVLPWYLVMIAASLLVAWWLARRCEQGRCSLDGVNREERLINGFSAGLIHLLLAAAVFIPFILRQEIFVSSYDNLGEIYPLVFLSKHKFAEMIRTRAWSLWNPFFHNGTPFFSSHWNMIYYPLNWLLFLVPDKALMTAVTFKTFLEVFLTGLLAYGFFAHEIRSRTWALVSSVAYQLCSFLIFALSIYPTISLYFGMTFYLYLLWTMPSRRRVWNYMAITLAVYMIMTSANIVFIFYALLALGVITVYRLLSHPSVAGDRPGRMVAGAVLTGWALSAVRILPCLQAIMHSNRIVSGYYTIHDRLIMFVRFFIPEIAGGFGPDSFNALTSPNLQLIFRQLDMPSNPQNAFFMYFGIIPAVLLLASLLIPVRGPHRFWKIYALGALAVGLLIQPFWGLLCILFFPFFHFSYHIIILPVGICALIGHTGRTLELGRFRLKTLGKRLIGLLILVLAVIFVFWTYLFPQLTDLTRWVLITGLAIPAIYLGIRARAREYVPVFMVGLTGVLNILTWSLLLFVGTMILVKPIPRKEFLIEAGWIPFLSMAAILVTGLIIYGLFAPQRRQRLNPPWIMAFVLLIPLVLVCLFGHPVFRRILTLPEGLRVYALDNMLALVRILLISQFVFWAFALYKTRALPAGLLRGLILLVLVGDLLVFNGRFDNITAPFYHKEAYYNATFSYADIRPELRNSMDLVNYRVHALHRAGLNANKNVIYSLPSYTGTLGYLSQRFSDFINYFGYPKGTILIYPADMAEDQRFLDLSAVRYTIESETTFSERPSALGRMNLYYDYEVYPDSQSVLERLTDPGFDLHRTVLLGNPPDGVESRQRSKPADVVTMTQPSSDLVQAKVNPAQSAILLFNESYHPGWRALVDGKRVEIQPANFHFMACAVGPGPHTVTFQFRPRSFYISLALSGLAGLFFILVSGWMVFSRRPIQSGK